ncbi:putative membrane protein [Bacillus sp. OV194]|nr:putative membrane protein [Bacillus sp. OV194]
MEINHPKNIHLYILLLTALVFVWSAFRPADYFTWVLEVSPAVLPILILMLTYKRFQFTTLSYSLFSIVFILMFIGGHYTYDDVPLFERIQNTFHLKRNDYDRFGHFFKGLTIIPVREVLLRMVGLPRRFWLILLSLSIILSLAAGYEIIEWLVAKMEGHSAKDFLGIQGDIWDSQWDMSLAFVGSIIGYLLLYRLHDQQLEKLR